MKWLVFAFLLASSPVAAQGIATWPGYSAEARPYARASLSADGPLLPGGISEKAFRSLEVHADSSPRVKFVERADGLRLLLYIDRDALVPFTLADAQLSPTARGLDKPIDTKTPGMIVPRGTKLDEVGYDENGRSKVRLAWQWLRDSFEVTGFIATKKIGPVYHKDDNNDDQYEDVRYVRFDPNVSVGGNFKLLDAPNGTPFAVSKQRKRVELMTLGRKDGFSLVRTGQGVVGWIPAKLTKRLPPPMQGWGPGGGGVGNGVSYKPTLPDKTPVYDSINGTFVGETEGWFHATPVEEVQGWLRFEIKTRFGMATVWARKP